MNNALKPTLFRVRVHLAYSNPEIWRLIEIDADLRLDQVHSALQTLFGWENSHLHTFEDHHPDTRWHPNQPEPRRWGSAFLREDDDEMLPEEQATLREVLTDTAPLFYTYDLGDRWLHQLDLIEVLPKTPTDNTVTVIRGERRGPLEDSGGITGYEDLLQIITDPADELYDESVEWVTGMTGAPATVFDPAAFDEKVTNQALRRRFPRRTKSDR